MILVDTSVWTEHLREGNHTLTGLLEQGTVLCHPWVVGEIALGRLDRRDEILGLLAGLPQATTASESEVLELIDAHALWGAGVGYVDAQLLAAALLASAALWTGDRRLDAAAARLGAAFDSRSTPGR